MSTNNILHPANGKPIITPSKDIVLGLYYLTMEDEGALGEGGIYASMAEIEHALHAKTLKLHAKIQVRYDTVDEKVKKIFKRIETTAGRMFVWNIMPRHHDIPFDVVNQTFKSKVSGLVDMVYRHCGQKEAVIFSDRLMALGFKYAGLSGISFGKDDLVVPDEKQKLVADTL